MLTKQQILFMVHQQAMAMYALRHGSSVTDVQQAELYRRLDEAYDRYVGDDENTALRLLPCANPGCEQADVFGEQQIGDRYRITHRCGRHPGNAGSRTAWHSTFSSAIREWNEMQQGRDAEAEAL